jgi:hypothetical protein
VGRSAETKGDTEVEGYTLVSADDKEVGEVVGKLGDSVVIEHGLIRKRRHVVPLAFASADDEARVLRSTLSKEMIESSPHVADDGVDEAEIAAYYGLAETTTPVESVVSSDLQARSDGLPAVEEDRAEMRDDLASGEGRLDRGESPGIAGGDRFRDADR